MPHRFFFYGTLLAGSGNAVAGAVHARLGVGRAGRVRGRMFAIADPLGWYPALVAGDGVVHGEVYEATSGFHFDDLALMDAYEGYDPAQPGASEYVRREVTARLVDGADVKVQAYIYARDLPRSSQSVAGGDFAAFLAERGLRAFAHLG